MQIPYSTIPKKTLIAAVGSALVDVCLQESDKFLVETGAQKGGMSLVDSDHIKMLLARSGCTPTIIPGGSACNTMLGIGKLGGTARFLGKKGNDDLGKIFETGLRNHNVEPILLSSPTATGHVLSIITPDAQRSMFTYLGASAETKPHEVTEIHFKDAALVHIEGYLLFNPDLMRAALNAAYTSGALISLDLASFTVVESARSLLEEITYKYVDILIANEDEARAFTGIANEMDAAIEMGKQAEIAIVKLGKRGSIVVNEGTITTINALGNGSAIDTTGAGDLWAAGFLYGLINGYTLEKCGQIASACGYEVCQVVGASIPEQGWERIRKFL